MVVRDLLDPDTLEKFREGCIRELRKILENSGKESIELKEELNTLLLYLDLEKVRTDGMMEYEMKIIPAIDLSEGKAVRLRQGDFAQKTVYYDDPVALAGQFEAAGLKALHVVDLDGARLGGPQNLEVLREICAKTGLEVDFGGGLREKAHVEQVLEAGAVQVTVGSVAARRPVEFREWIDAFGAERFVLGADARAGKIAVAGWMEVSEISLEDFIREYLGLGIKHVLCTAIERDGMLTGPDFGLYQRLGELFPEMKLIASGGVSGADDLVRLQEMGLYGGIVGKAFYEGRITLKRMAELEAQAVTIEKGGIDA